jgi:multiple sugar transport system permease protein
MAAPFLIGVAILVVLPMLVTAWASLFEWDLVTSPRYRGSANFRELAGDASFRDALRNSLGYVAVATPIRVLLALGLAMVLARASRGGGVGRTGVTVPAIVPDVAFAALWLWILNPLYGPLNALLGAVGLPTPSWLTDAGAARWGVILMGAFLVGEAFIIVLAGRRALSADLLEQAASLGAGRWSRFTRVTLPLLAPVLLLVACRDIAMSFQATFTAALIVTEGGPPPNGTLYLPTFVYREAFEYLRYGYASAAIVVMFLLTAALVWLTLRAVDRLRGGVVLGGFTW